MKTLSLHHSAPSRQGGFAVVAVLLIVALIATIGATYTRHTFMTGHTRPAAPAVVASREAVLSSLQVARQAMSSGTSAAELAAASGGSMHADTAVLPVQAGAGAATLQLAALPGDRMRCDARSLDDYGLGATVMVESSRVAAGKQEYSGPEDLPGLSRDTIQGLLDDATISKTYYTGHTTLTDTDLTGMIILGSSSTLTLEGVVITGLIVSESALASDPLGDYDASTAPQIILAGNVRIRAGSFLPGVAVVLPDGAIMNSSSENGILIEDDIVAHSVTLDGPGALLGNVAHVDPLVLHPELHRPGHGRGVERWTSNLDMGDVWEHEFLAFVPRRDSVADLSAISDYFAHDEDAGGPSQ